MSWKVVEYPDRPAQERYGAVESDGLAILVLPSEDASACYKATSTLVRYLNSHGAKSRLVSGFASTLTPPESVPTLDEIASDTDSK